MNQHQSSAQDGGKGREGLSAKEKGCLLLFFSPVLGAVLGYLLAAFMMNFINWFSGWNIIQSPPEPATEILQSNGDAIWVKTLSGNIYLNASSKNCRSNCWEMVGSWETDFPLNPGELERRAETCLTSPPLFMALDTSADCLVNTWTDYSSVYALLWNRNILSWHQTSGGEYVLLEVLFWIAIGVIIAVLFSVIRFIRIIRPNTRSPSTEPFDLWNRPHPDRK